MIRKRIVCSALFASLTLGAALGFSVGRATWTSPTIAPTTTSVSMDASISGAPVAHFNNRYFTTVEGAVTAASALGQEVTVYVDPGINPTITKSFTIGSKVTLCLPYSTNYSSWWKAGMNGKNPNAYLKPATYRKSLVTVGDADHQGITITNYGTIQIGGIINGGGGGQDLASNTSGDYAELTFFGDSSLISYGAIQNYGYITGTNCTGTVIFKSNSNTQLVYSVREHRGGTCLSQMYYNLKSFPMSRWYFAGLRDIDSTFESGSKLVGFIDMYASSSHYNTTINFIGGPSSSALVALASGTKLKCRFDTPTMITQYHFYGSFTFNTLSMHMIVDLTTESVEFPLSWYQQVFLHPFENGNSASVTSPKQAIKMLPNAVLSIDKKVSVTAKKIALYDATYIDPHLHVADYKNDFSETNPMVDATCLVNGTLTCTYFGGVATTTEAGASLNYTTGSVTTYEVARQVNGSVEYNSYTWAAKGKLTADGSYVNLASSSGKYVSSGTYWTVK